MRFACGAWQAANRFVSDDANTGLEAPQRRTHYSSEGIDRYLRPIDRRSQLWCDWLRNATAKGRSDEHEQPHSCMEETLQMKSFFKPLGAAVASVLLI